MANARHPGKKLIGAQASPELWRAVDQWLKQHAPATVTDFVIQACLEKLKGENIPVDALEVLRDRRARKPVRYTSGSKQRSELNDK